MTEYIISFSFYSIIFTNMKFSSWNMRSDNDIKPFKEKDYSFLMAENMKDTL